MDKKQFAPCSAVVLALAIGATSYAHALGNDDRLTADALVEQVMRDNSGLQSLEHAVDAASSREIPAGALDDPILGYAIAPRSIGVHDLDTGHILRFEQPLPWFGKRTTRRAAARSATASENAALDAGQLRAMLMARLLYADWYFVHGALDVNDAQQRALTELEDTAEGLYRSGLGSQGGVLTASLRREQRVQEALTLRANRDGIAARINALRSQPVGTRVAPPGALPAQRSLPDLAVVASALGNDNPDLARLAALEDRSAQQAALAELDYRPDFRLTAQYLGTLPREENRGQIGFVLNLPFGQRKRDAALDAARSDQARLAAKQIDRRNELLAELASVHAKAQSAIRTFALYHSRLLPLAQQAQEAALADFAAGSGTARDVIDAEEDLLTTRLGALRAETDIYKYEARLRWLAGPAPFESTASNNAQE
nr:TolC family protein [Oceanococcus sp. HetDA_MAG_MS8]